MSISHKQAVATITQRVRRHAKRGMPASEGDVRKWISHNWPSMNEAKRDQVAQGVYGKNEAFMAVGRSVAGRKTENRMDNWPNVLVERRNYLQNRITILTEELNALNTYLDNYSGGDRDTG